MYKWLDRLFDNCCCLMIAFISTSLLWQVLEIVFYGEIQPRRVDDIIAFVWAVITVLAYKRGLKHGRSGNNE